MLQIRKRINHQLNYHEWPIVNQISAYLFPFWLKNDQGLLLTY